MIASQLQQSLEQDKRKGCANFTPSATITSLVDEPLFYTGFCEHQEEIPSSMESDTGNASSNSSLYSLDRAPSAEYDFDIDYLLPEILGEDGDYSSQPYACAEAVSIISAGRPTLIDLLKTTGPSTSLTAKRLTLQRTSCILVESSPPKSIAARSSMSSHSSKGTVHTRNSSESDTKSFFSEASSVPSTPILDAHTESPKIEQSPITPTTIRLPSPTTGTMRHFKPIDSLYDTFGPSSAPIQEQSARKYTLMRMFPKRAISTNAVVNTDPLNVRASTPFMPSFSFRPQTPQWNSALKAKMVARDAGAREPVISLPPSPIASTFSASATDLTRSMRKDSIASHRGSSVFKNQRLRRMASSFGLNEL